MGVGGRSKAFETSVSKSWTENVGERGEASSSCAAGRRKTCMSDKEGDEEDMVVVGEEG